MCYSIVYYKKWNKLKQQFQFGETPFPEKEETGVRVFPYKPTKVVARSPRTKELVLVEMNYSLVPSWSKEPKVKWATYNARLNREEGSGLKKIYEVPTWRESFGVKNCIVPITHFYESCREGEASGLEVSFHNPNDEILYCAGIYSYWKKEGKDLLSFAIITTEPTKYMEKVGHDRSPLFLNKESANRWLESFTSPVDAYEFLESSHEPPELTWEKVRELKKVNS